MGAINFGVVDADSLEDLAGRAKTMSATIFHNPSGSSDCISKHVKSPLGCSATTRYRPSNLYDAAALVDLVFGLGGAKGDAALEDRKTRTGMPVLWLWVRARLPVLGLAL